MSRWHSMLILWPLEYTCGNLFPFLLAFHSVRISGAFAAFSVSHRCPISEHCFRSFSLFFFFYRLRMFSLVTCDAQIAATKKKNWNLLIETNFHQRQQRQHATTSTVGMSSNQHFHIHDVCELSNERWRNLAWTKKKIVFESNQLQRHFTHIS